MFLNVTTSARKVGLPLSEIYGYSSGCINTQQFRKAFHAILQEKQGLKCSVFASIPQVLQGEI